jgi:ribosomal protein L37AE/L43A
MKPLCVDCGETFSIRRRELGYRLCLTCGETEARKVTYPSAPINKSNYMLITSREQLRQLNPKRIGDG